MKKWLIASLGVALVLMTSGLASAQYAQDFESINASPGGTVLTGQDGYYIPTGSTSVDFNAFTYAGNAYAVPQNPQGGTKFVAGDGPGDGVTYARAQRDVSFGVGVGVWRVSYDLCAKYLGTAPSSNNIGSFSLRYNDANVHEIHLITWVDPNVPTTFNAWYLNYDASGVQVLAPGSSPGAAWSNLSVDHWYRFTTTLDLDQNKIVEVSITDLSTMQQTIFDPVDWFLVGGAGGAAGPPQNFRIFAGGGTTPGNVTAWDNIGIAEALPGGACCLADGSCVMSTQTECQGTYQGDGTVCDPNPCPPVPTRSTSWGSIKNQYK